MFRFELVSEYAVLRKGVCIARITAPRSEAVNWAREDYGEDVTVRHDPDGELQPSR